MTVDVLLEEYEHDPPEVAGVYLTRELAEAAAAYGSDPDPDADRFVYVIKEWKVRTSWE
jgi:phosphomannomutase